MQPPPPPPPPGDRDRGPCRTRAVPALLLALLAACGTITRPAERPHAFDWDALLEEEDAARAEAREAGLDATDGRAAEDDAAEPLGTTAPWADGIDLVPDDGAGGALPGGGAVAAPDAAEDDAAEQGFELDGALSVRWAGRRRRDEVASDAIVGLVVDGGDADRDPWTFHVDGRVKKGFGPDRDPDFEGLVDTFHDETQWSLWSAWVETHDDPAIERFRIGRQTDFETPVQLLYDGLHVRTAAEGPMRVRYGLYGGLSHHEYDRGPDGDDGLYGLYADLRPWDGGRARLDWVHSDDGRTVDRMHDDLWGVHLWQDVQPARLEAAWTALESDPRDLRLAGTWSDAASGLVVRASRYELLSTQREQALEFDPLSSSLFDLYPYTDTQLSVSKAFDTVVLTAGRSRRDVDDSSDEGAFNRDVDRTWVTAAVDGVVGDDDSLSVTGTSWDADGRDRETWGAEFTHAFAEAVDASLGTFYSLYETDLLTGTEREDVRVWYLRYDQNVTEGVETDLAYEYETGDTGTWHTVKARLTWRF